MSGGLFQLLLDLRRKRLDIQLLQQLLHRFGAHAGVKFVLIGLPVLVVLPLAQQGVLFQLGVAGVNHDIGGKIQYLFQHAGAQVQQQAHPAGGPLEIPDMRNGGGQLDVAHPFAAHLGAGHFHAAALAHLALKADALILSAVAFPVLGRPKDALAEQAVALRLQGAVVDGFRFLDLAIAPGTDLVGRSKADLDRIELFIFHSANPLI